MTYVPTRIARPTLLVRDILPILGLFIAAAYLLLLPFGMKGLLIALAGLACTTMGINRVSMGVYFLLWGSLLLGSLFRCAGIEKVGTISAYLIAFFFLFIPKAPTIAPLRLRNKLPFLWLFVTTGVVCIAFTYGPITSYSMSKLFFFVFNLLTVSLAFYYIVAGKEMSLLRLSMFAFAAAVVHYASIRYRFPAIMPSSIFESSGLRMYWVFSEGDAIPENNVLAFMACSSIMMAVCASVDKRQNVKEAVAMLIIILFGTIILFSSGQRKWIVSLVVGVVSILAVKPKNRWIAGTVVFVVPVIVVALIILAVIHEDRLITYIYEGIMHEDGRLVELVGRGDNFDSAINRIKERPIVGYGLGGYYVDGYSVTNRAAYPHNLVLELLSETGTVGTIIILLPPILIFILPSFRRIMSFRTATSATILPLFFMWFSIALVSWDLRFSSAVFAIVGVTWAACVKESESQDWKLFYWNRINGNYDRGYILRNNSPQ